MTTDALHLALVWAAMIGSVGCGSAGQTTSTALFRPNIGAVPADLQVDYQSFVQNCSKCHDLERALNAPVTDNRQWDLYVKKMMRTAGSGVQARESPHILRFLYWYTDRKTGRTSANDENPVAASPSQQGASPAVSPPHQAEPLPAPQTAPAQAPLLAPSVGHETPGESTP